MSTEWANHNIKYTYYIPVGSNTLHRESKDPETCEYVGLNNIWKPSCHNSILNKDNKKEWKEISQKQANKMRPNLVPAPSKVKYFLNLENDKARVYLFVGLILHYWSPTQGKFVDSFLSYGDILNRSVFMPITMAQANHVIEFEKIKLTK
jgi:hypothetical protein